jgi:hypothetical protein
MLIGGIIENSFEHGFDGWIGRGRSCGPEHDRH